MKKKPEFKIQNITPPSKPLADYNDPLRRELVAHLRQTLERGGDGVGFGSGARL